MEVKYLDLPRQFKDGAIIEALKDHLRRCQFILGPELEEFESRFARLCKACCAVGVNSGTDALFLSLRALDIGRGDEVITVPNTFIATIGAIVATGARPVFVDVGADYNMNPELIKMAITRRTKAILPVHLTGNPADMLRILKIVNRYKLYLIEDAAQAVGASIDGRPVGSFGALGCFSLHPLKNLNVWGDGGVIVTNSKRLYHKLLILRNHGLKGRDRCFIFGYNSRLDTLQAIVANRLMDKLKTITNKRIENAREYDAGLCEFCEYVTIPPRRENVRQVFHTYVIQVKERDKLRRYLARNKIETKVHYPLPMHLQQASKYLGYKRGDFPVCESQAKRIITLPIHQHLTNRQIEYVVDKIRRFYRQ